MAADAALSSCFIQLSLRSSLIEQHFFNMDGYLDYNVDKKKTREAANKFVWVLFAFAGLFIFTIVRFALTSDTGANYTGLPDSDAVFEMSKQFVIPTVQGATAFSNNGYEYGQLRDSVYVIRSYVYVTENGATHQIKYTITLKYKGGSVACKQDYEVVNFKEYY